MGQRSLSYVTFVKHPIYLTGLGPFLDAPEVVLDWKIFCSYLRLWMILGLSCELIDWSILRFSSNDFVWEQIWSCFWAFPYSRVMFACAILPHCRTSHCLWRFPFGVIFIIRRGTPYRLLSQLEFRFGDVSEKCWWFQCCICCSRNRTTIWFRLEWFPCSEPYHSKAIPFKDCGNCLSRSETGWQWCHIDV